MERFHDIVSFIKEIYSHKEFIPLHEPVFRGNEKKYVADAIDSTFVSSVGAYVNRFEDMMREITGAGYAVATGNGTVALHIALLLAGVQPGDEVLTQSLSFVATSNAISYAGAKPVFIDVDKKESLGLSASALRLFLEKNAEKRDGGCYNKLTGKRIAACVPMHTFGFPVNIIEVVDICTYYNIPVIEDAAESLGSFVGNKHTGTFGQLGTYSFNGNKTVTAGGGGCIVTDDKKLAVLAKHLTTTAKVSHRWEYVHDMVGYNYRMPNLNAALVCAQLEQLTGFIENKRMLADRYKEFCAANNIYFFKEAPGTKANYWLNTVILDSKETRDAFLEYTNSNGVMTRPAWELSNNLPMYKDCVSDDLENSKWLLERIVNIPSSVTPA